MLKRLWTGGLAGGGALVLVFALSGMVAAATVLTALTVPAPETAPITADTTATFEDLDGNGVDDDCQDGIVEANPEAEASAAATVDADGDGSVSVTEAAHSDRTGGTNCNHGGYVSSVADDEDVEEAEETEEAPVECAATEPVDEPTTGTEGETGTDADEAVVEDEPAANAHGTTVSEVAKSDAVGGKNCNHGGAVNEAAHDKAELDAARAARDEARAARAEARAEAKAARDAARAERKANRGKGHGG